MARKLERAIRRPEQEERYQGMNVKQVGRDNLAYEQIKAMSSEFYQGVDPRRRKEMADAGMIEEDHRAMANLSPDFIHTEYPRFSFFSTPYNDDLMQGE